MKKIALIVLLIGGFLLYQYYQTDQQNGSDARISIEGLPWQIEELPEGQSRVFGLVLGQVTLADAFKVLGQDRELAIIAMLNEPGSLEAYYPRYTAGVLTGKLILVAGIEDQKLAEMRKRAVSIDYTGSGAKKYRLHKGDMAYVDSLPVATVTFVPSVNFDHDTIIKRFGKPDHLIVANTNTSHYLYHDKGVDIILNQKGKEVMQYVAPKDFGRLSEVLLKPQQGDSEEQ